MNRTLSSTPYGTRVEHRDPGTGQPLFAEYVTGLVATRSSRPTTGFIHVLISLLAALGGWSWLR
ncbi:MAG: hypothetical protein SFY95_02730 [Planctomycetota bacterium]|nr:hypothetical protein [Planctomycetota bacterium]